VVGEKDPEQLLAEALRAQAVSSGRFAAPPSPRTTADRPAPAEPEPTSTPTLLLIAILLGLVTGVVAGLVSML